MPAAKLEALPNELLQNICGHLEEHKPSLGAFSLTSTKCDAAAVTRLFRKIHLVNVYPKKDYPLDSPPNVPPSIERWDCILSRRGARRHVRELVVTEKHVTSEPLLDGPPLPNYMDTVDSDDDFAEPPHRSPRMPEILEDGKHNNDTFEDIWCQLADLVRSLPSLAHLVWDWSWPLPQAVLQTLQPPSSIRLHLNTFWFPGGLRLDNASPHELALLTECRLHTIKSRSTGYTYYCEAEYTHDSILALVTSMNATVRQVSFLYGEAYHHGGIMMHQAIWSKDIRKPWPRFAGWTTVTPKSAPLRSLEIGGQAAVDPDFFRQVFRECDLRALRVLKLRVSYSHKGLAWLASNLDLPLLEVLVFGSPGSASPDDDFASPLLRALRPLQSIRFIADLDRSAFEATLERHGLSLRRLWFPPPHDDSHLCSDAERADDDSHLCFDAERVSQLQRYCPLLEDVAISVPRSQGDAVEVGIYSSLGRLSRLKRLRLTLDCEDTSLDLRRQSFDPTPIYEDFDDFDKQYLTTAKSCVVGHGRKPRKGHLRRSIMNAALDETLAKSIFETICAAKPGCSSDLNLERLELRPVRGKYIWEAHDVLNHVAKWWLVERHVAGNGTSIPVATRLRSPSDVDDEELGPPTKLLNDQIEPIFRKIWPHRTKPDSGWSDDWKGLPLALGAWQ